MYTPARPIRLGIPYKAAAQVFLVASCGGTYIMRVLYMLSLGGPDRFIRTGGHDSAIACRRRRRLTPIVVASPPIDGLKYDPLVNPGPDTTRRDLLGDRLKDRVSGVSSIRVGMDY
jgi:hypothetical protein